MEGSNTHLSERGGGVDVCLDGVATRLWDGLEHVVETWRRCCSSLTYQLQSQI